MEIDNRQESPEDRPYEPPSIESVLTADELTREIKYAGDDGNSIT